MHGEKIAAIPETKDFVVLVDGKSSSWEKFTFFIAKYSKPARGRKQIRKIFWQL